MSNSMATSPGRTFQEVLADGGVLVQRCDDCDAHRFPPMPYCCFCGSGACHEVTLPGAGTLYSWIVIHRTLRPDFRDQTPYVIGIVDLEVPVGLVRVPARIEVDDPAVLAHDEPVELLPPRRGSVDIRFRPLAS